MTEPRYRPDRPGDAVRAARDVRRRARRHRDAHRGAIRRTMPAGLLRRGPRRPRDDGGHVGRDRRRATRTRCATGCSPRSTTRCQTCRFGVPDGVPPCWRPRRLWSSASGALGRRHGTAARSRRRRPPQQVFAAPDVRTVSGTLPTGGTATLVFSHERDAGVLVMNNVPPPTQGTVYQMWLVGNNGPHRRARWTPRRSRRRPPRCCPTSATPPSWRSPSSRAPVRLAADRPGFRATAVGVAAAIAGWPRRPRRGRRRRHACAARPAAAGSPRCRRSHDAAQFGSDVIVFAEHRAAPGI